MDMKNIKEWYIATFPTDELGNEINPKATFKVLKNILPRVYAYLNVSDSLVRERVFAELAKRMNVNYEVVYNKWLYTSL